MEHPQQPVQPQWHIPAPPQHAPIQRLNLKRVALTAVPILGLMILGAIVSDDEAKERPLVVGGCLATDAQKPASVPCDDPSANMMIYRILEVTTSADGCQFVPGVTAAYTVTESLRVGGEQGIDVADTGSRVLCVGPKTPR
ncbi:hypothetical protein ACIQUQ_29700 [Streptomyces sp. NPDC101118]|uniref:hypothetical protein n=1 Tax=Streptomyces sp. NPDC101118 TaxID=3366109 RepID=UPI003827BBAE